MIDLTSSEIEKAATTADERVAHFDALAAETAGPEWAKAYQALASAYQTLATELRA